jgi:predicted dehydrogenase
MNAGVGALVEKPFASDPGQASELIGVAEKSGTVLVAAQVMRHLPMFVWARQRIEAGDLGQPIQVIERRLTDRSDNYPWWAKLPAFLVSHWGSHSLDLICDLLGDRGSEVLCQADSIRSELGVIDDFGLQVRLASGARAVSVMSFSSRLEVHDLVIIGTDATLSFQCYQSASINGELALELSQEEMISIGFTNQLKDFLGALNGAPSRGDPRSVLSGLELVRAAEASALGSGLVKI